MARRTKEEAGQTREAILDAAEQVFHEKGVSRSSLEEIARRAGCTRGAVYWHFAHKRDVLQALGRRIDTIMAERRERMRQAAQDDPMAAMREFLHYIADELLEDPHGRTILDILFHRCEYVDEMRELGEIVDDEHDSKHREFVAMFARAQELGQVRSDVPAEVCAIMIRTLLEGIMRTSLLDFGACRRSSGVSNAQMVDFFLGSLGYRCGGAPWGVAEHGPAADPR
ncbi:TetR family transcriptional regulator [Coralloluteibacterium stylophorae]|uniref:TetR family transcriptional regulator n=1 Tax=Coralloluteibacterium stylophorae TaxID=1776034 RepID=A0A8J7VTZ3_9GAMM|nr:TetR family transcriptional regulator [Coralloluteibacterium stylophorae]MBS7457563.1 TetR family transcriptional regulator [Coralloluteibacterium stylophorae]